MSSCRIVFYLPHDVRCTEFNRGPCHPRRPVSLTVSDFQCVDSRRREVFPRTFHEVKGVIPATWSPKVPAISRRHYVENRGQLTSD